MPLCMPLTQHCTCSYRHWDTTFLSQQKWKHHVPLTFWWGYMCPSPLSLSKLNLHVSLLSPFLHPSTYVSTNATCFPLSLSAKATCVSLLFSHALSLCLSQLKLHVSLSISDEGTCVSHLSFSLNWNLHVFLLSISLPSLLSQLKLHISLYLSAEATCVSLVSF